MESVVNAAEQSAAPNFDALMQYKLAEQQAGHDASAAVLAQHGITPDRVLPEAAPSVQPLELVTEADWRDIAASPTPFTELWSKSNRRVLEDRIHQRYVSYDPLTGKEVAHKSNRMDVYDAFRAEALLHAQPGLYSTSVDTLTKARAHRSFLSNRAVHDLNGGYEGMLTDIGNTWEEDREAGLDGYVFVDFARPATRRLEEQAEAVVVLKPEAMHAEGTIVTDHDYVDTLFRSETTDPYMYMSRLYTAEDFYETASMQASTKASANGHTENGVFIPNRLRIYETIDGQDGDYDIQGMPHFSTWEVKIPEVPYGAADRIIFRSEEARDKFVVQNPDNTTLCIVEPDIRAAMNRGEDIFGSKAREKAILDEKMAEDYEKRKALIEAADKNTLTVEYKKVGSEESLYFDPDWSDVEAFESADEIVTQEQKTRRMSRAVMSLFADDEEPTGQYDDRQIHIARIVRAGDTSVIEEINAY